MFFCLKLSGTFIALVLVLTIMVICSYACIFCNQIYAGSRVFFWRGEEVKNRGFYSGLCLVLYEVCHITLFLKKHSKTHHCLHIRFQRNTLELIVFN